MNYSNEESNFAWRYFLSLNITYVTSIWTVLEVLILKWEYENIKAF